MSTTEGNDPMTMTDEPNDVDADLAELGDAVATARDPNPDPPVDPDVSAALPALPEPSTAVDIPLIPGRDEFLSLAMQAKMFASAEIVPKALRGKPSDILLVLMTGRDLGITPTAALRKCYVVDGQVTVAPALKIALVRIKGLGAVRPPARYLPGVRDGDGNPIPDPDYPNDRTRATAIAYDAAGIEIGRASLTFDDVRDVSNGNKGKLVDKDNWRNYPHRMLWWRVATTVVDDIFPEVAFGVYDADSLGAITGEDGEVIELDSVEVPSGFVRERARRPDGTPKPDPDTPIGDDAAMALRDRASALPDGGKEALRTMARGRDVPLVFSEFTHKRATVVSAMLDTIEKRAARGEWGEWSPPEPAAPPVATAPDDAPDNAMDPPDDDITDICGTCGDALTACTCDHDHPSGVAPMDTVTLEMVVRLPRDAIVALGVDELRAACVAAHADWEMDCDADDLAALLLDAVKPFDADDDGSTDGID